MPEVVTMKNVDDQVWRLFKGHAAQKGEALGKHFAFLVRKECSKPASFAEALHIMDTIKNKAEPNKGESEIATWRKRA